MDFGTWERLSEPLMPASASSERELQSRLGVQGRTSAGQATGGRTSDGRGRRWKNFGRSCAQTSVHGEGFRASDAGFAAPGSTGEKVGAREGLRMDTRWMKGLGPDMRWAETCGIANPASLAHGDGRSDGNWARRRVRARGIVDPVTSVDGDGRSDGNWARRWA
ncbi:hypothetical protein COCNU_scaffold000183G000020 [Cocos nucifera]|nr:hypothetical protein [Cocos nucifera]